MEQNNLVFEVDGTIYELVYNFKDAFQKETFEDNTLAIATNENSGTITVYTVNKKTGELTVVASKVVVPEAVCTKFI